MQLSIKGKDAIQCHPQHIFRIWSEFGTGQRPQARMEVIIWVLVLQLRLCRAPLDSGLGFLAWVNAGLDYFNAWLGVSSEATACPLPPVLSSMIANSRRQPQFCFLSCLSHKIIAAERKVVPPGKRAKRVPRLR